MTDLTREQKEALGRMIIEGCKKNDPEIVAGCLRRGADPNIMVQDGDSGARRPLIHWAAANFNEKAAQTLVDGGADVNARDGDGNTALFLAMGNYNDTAVEFLMRNGGDPLAQNNAKVVALDVARSLRTDYASYKASRDKIIKALTKDYGLPREKPKVVKSDAPVVEQVAGNGPQDDDIHVLKPLSLQPKRTGPGFNL